jgi:hypothetical protein
MIELRACDSTTSVKFDEQDTRIFMYSKVLSNIWQDAGDCASLEVPICTHQTLLLLQEYMRCSTLCHIAIDTESERAPNGETSSSSSAWQWRTLESVRTARALTGWKLSFFRRHFCSNKEALPTSLEDVAYAVGDEDMNRLRQRREAHAVPTCTLAQLQALGNFLSTVDFLNIVGLQAETLEWLARDIVRPCTLAQLRDFFKVEDRRLGGFTHSEHERLLLELSQYDEMYSDDDADASECDSDEELSA